MLMTKKKSVLTCLNLLAIVAGFNLGNINSTWAKPVTYDFTVKVVEGSLKGNSYSGFFTYDDEKLVNQGQEIMTVEQGLKVCMNFFEQMRDESKDVDYPQYPQLILQDGQPETLDFWIEPSERRIWWNQDGWEVTTTLVEDQEAIAECSSSSE